MGVLCFMYAKHRFDLFCTTVTFYKIISIGIQVTERT